MREGQKMETNTQQERAKRLEQQAREYLMQSNDPIFTRYLQQLLPRIQRQPEYVEQLQAELDKSVEFWYQRQQINANRGGETGAESSVPQQSVPQETAAGEQQTAGQSQTQPVGQFTMQYQCGQNKDSANHRQCNGCDQIFRILLLLCRKACWCWH